MVYALAFVPLEQVVNFYKEFVAAVIEEKLEKDEI